MGLFYFFDLFALIQKNTPSRTLNPFLATVLLGMGVTSQIMALAKVSSIRQFKRRKVWYVNCTPTCVTMGKTYCQEYDGQVAHSETKVGPAKAIYIV